MTIGHNSKRAKADPVNADRLKSFVERIEKLEEERKAIGSDVRDIYAEAKGHRYNPKALRKIIAMRKQKADPVVDAEVDAYKAALGMAVEMVSNGGVSLRKAAKETGVSKSSVHRALAVPAVSHDEVASAINQTDDQALTAMDEEFQRFEAMKREKGVA